MSYQWLQMRISEEIDRRKRESAIHERLPRALEEFHAALSICVDGYREAFGAESAEIQKAAGHLRITVRAQRDRQWQQIARVDIATTTSIPGFQIDKGAGGEPFIVEVGILPGDKLFYRDRAKDQYVTMEELTRRTVDRAFFPDLNE